MKIVNYRFVNNFNNITKIHSIYMNCFRKFIFNKNKINSSDLKAVKNVDLIKSKKITSDSKDTITNENTFIEQDQTIDYYNEKLNNIKFNKINKQSSKPMYISPNLNNLSTTNESEFEVKYIEELTSNEISTNNVSLNKQISGQTSGRLGLRGNFIDKNSVLNKAFGNQKNIKLDYTLIKDNLIKKKLIVELSDHKNDNDKKNDIKNEEKKNNIVKLDDKHEAVKDNKKSFNDHFSDSCKMFFKAGDGGNGSIAFYRGGMLDQSKNYF